jgi:uncharacterized membrane protein
VSRAPGQLAQRPGDAGVLCGVVRFLRSEVSAVRGVDVEGERRKLRQVLGYYLLLGLEFLIAADIIDTLMKPATQCKPPPPKACRGAAP